MYYQMCQRAPSLSDILGYKYKFIMRYMLNVYVDIVSIETYQSFAI